MKINYASIKYIFSKHSNTSPLEIGLKSAFLLVLFSFVFQTAVKAWTTDGLNNTLNEEVSGIVTDSASNKPLMGVTIQVKGGSVGTTTDVNGQFSLSVPENAVLIVSYLGYNTKTINVNGRASINIKLTPATQGLKQLVVTALGIKKEKRSLGYAVQEVKGKSLQKVRTPTVMGSLTGKVAGLTVYNSPDLFQNPSVQLRGRDPLVVIDGIPNRDGDPWKVNADNIKSITVLKGSTASALYGSIGRNGAIMITTKNGAGKKGLQVQFNSSTMLQTGFIRIPDVQTQYGNGNNGNYAYVNGSGSGTEGGGWIWGPKLNQKDPSTPSGYWETPQAISPIDSNTGKRIPLPWITRGQNNLKNFFRTGVISTNNLSVTWGGEKGSFRASAAHIYQKGIIPNMDLNNSSFSLAGNYDLGESVKVNASITYNKEYTDNFPTTPYGPNNILYNLVLWTGADIDIRDFRDYWVDGKEGLQQKWYNNSWYNNPYFIAYEYLRGYHKDNTFGSVSLDYQITPSIKATLRSGINLYGLSRSTKEPYSYIAYGTISRGNYYITKSNYFDITTDAIVKYNDAFIDNNLSVDIELGASNFYSNYKSVYVHTDGLTIPGFYNLSNSTNPIQASNTIQEIKNNSVYGSAQFGIFHTFYLTLTGRNDWVSTLPLANNSFFYPSVSGALILSELLDLPSWLSVLKVRGSWSRVSDGTINIDGGDPEPYGAIQTYDIGTKWNNVPSLVWGGTLLSTNLHPETSDSWETGIHLNLFKNRINLDLAYYEAKDYNNLTQLVVSNASGYENHLVNGNVYERKGFEMMLSTTPIQSNAFQWNIGINLSTNHRYLKQIYEDKEELGNLKVGDRMDRLYISVYDESPEGKTIIGSNGFPAWDPFQRFIGYGDPDWVYGVQNSFGYKQFSLNISVDGRIGGLMYSSTNQKMWWGGTAPGTVNHYRDEANAGKATFIADGVVVTGGNIKYDPEGNIISDTRKFAPNEKAVNYIAFMQNNSQQMYEDYFYYKETFLKLREVSLTYQFSENLLNNTFIHSASLSLIGNNLLLISEIPNVDPDSGADDLQTPSFRKVGFNINLTF